MVGVEDDHLRRASRLAARLDDPRERVEALHERDRTGRGAAAGEQLRGRPDVRQVRPGAGPVLEQHPLGLRETENRVHRVLHGIDEARRALRMLLEADVEPDGAVERRLLIDEQVLEVVRERLQIVVAREVLLFGRPRGDGVDDAADQLLDGPLTLRRADGAAEILGDDDVRGLLRPEARDLDVALLENNGPLLVADDGGPDVPFDLVERIDPFLRKEAAVLEAGRARGRDRAYRRVRAGRFRFARPAGRTDVGSSAILHLTPPDVSPPPAPGRDPETISSV